MTTELEEHLAAGMRESVGGLSLDGDIVGRARRHRRRTATIRWGYSLGVAGLAAIVAVGLTVGGHPPQRTNLGPVAGAPPAAVRLAAAESASEHLSYHVRQVSGTLTYEGAFDPATSTGYLRSAREDGVLTELLINGTRYIGTEPPPGGVPPRPQGGEKYSRYGQYPGRYDRLSFGLGMEDSISDVSATSDPAALFQKLRDAHATITENPDGTVHFAFADGTDADNRVTTVGDVTLDGHHRVAKVACVIVWRTTAKERLDTGQFTVTTELTDYGTPVVVKRPKDVVKVH